jgi:hypothetical protein
MKLFEATVHFVLKDTDTRYLIKKYAVLADSTADAYITTLSNHIKKDELIIDIFVREENRKLLALFPEEDIERHPEITKLKQRRDPIVFYISVGLVALISFVMLAYIIVIMH